MPMIMQQYSIYTTRAISSSRKAVFVLPVPDTARKNTCPPTARKYDELMTTMAGTEAWIRSGISVYIRAIASGKRQNNRTIAETSPYESFMMRFTSDITFS